jgi:ribosomal protein S18 acetylase RimI-like enzyme
MESTLTPLPDCPRMGATSVHEPDCIRLNQIYLLLEHQNRGIGTACLTRILEEAGALGRPVRLGVLKVNPRAMALYRRLGFLPTGETDTHVRMERPSSRERPKGK